MPTTATPSKSELRRLRKQARAEGRPLEGALAVDRGAEPLEFSESASGYRARDRWARRYDALNGAPEGEWDR